nr:hypothetical protein [Deltaproteobacteria bacterium]
MRSLSSAATGALCLALGLSTTAALAQTTEPAAAEPAAAEPAAEPAAAEPAATGDGDAAAETTPAATPARSVPAVPALTPEAQATLGVAPGAVPSWPDPDRNVHRTLVPPFLLLERSANRRTTVVFPFLFRERRGQDVSLLVPPYYQYRSPTARTDVVFPVYFRWRGLLDDGGRFATDIIPPVYAHSWEGPARAHGSAFGVAPLFFYGDSFDRTGALAREHLVIPPLLTFHTWRPEHALTIAGPFFYDRQRHDTDWGLAPLFFAGNDLTSNYLLIPPLLTYHTENRAEGSNLTVVGPFWTRNTADSGSFNLAPIFFHRHDRTTSRTTLFPLFHTYSGPDERTFVSPVAYYHREGADSTLVTPVYQRHRGATNWDAVLPFFYSSREPATGAHTEAVLPLFYHRRTEASNTWWVLPTIHSHSEPGSSYLNIYPLLYTGRSGPRRHTVFAPLFFDFANSETGTRATMVTPLFWRFSTPESVHMLAGNFLWISSQRQGVRSFEWHLLPVFSYARPRPEDVSWNVLFGLVGYRRQGTHSQLRLLYIPINL